MRKNCEYYMIARATKNNEPEKGLQDIPYCRKIAKVLDEFDYCLKCSYFKRG